MRDEHADACACPRCVPVRLVWTDVGQPLSLRAALDAKMPAVLARDLRAVYAPVTDANPLLDRELARLDAALAR